MKVLMVSPYRDPAFGGVSQVVPELVKVSSSIDCQIDWISTCSGKGQEWHSTSPFSHQKFFSRVSRNDLIWSAPLVYWFKQNVWQYDLVHFHTIFSPMMTRLARIALRSSVPYWVTPHGMLDSWAIQHRGFKKKLYWNLFERSVFKRAAKIHVLHSGEEKAVRRRGIQTPTVLIPNGVNPLEKLSREKESLFWNRYPEFLANQRILFLGRIHSKKGIDALIRAFVEILKSRAQTCLIIAGPNEQKTQERLQKLAKILGVAERIKWVGLLSGEEKQAALQGADCFVLPSHSEGLSQAILEAFAAGVPTAITPECSFDQVIESDGAWRIERDPKKMAETIISILQDSQKARVRAKIGQNYVFKHHLWSSIGVRLRSAYQEK